VIHDRFDSRTGIGSPFLIVERDTGATFRVPSHYFGRLSDVVTAFDAGFRRPSYDLTITSVQDLKVTTECLPVTTAALCDLPATIGGVGAWYDFSTIARINRTGCCQYFAQPCERLLHERRPTTRDDYFHLTVVAVRSIEGAVKFLASLRASAIAAAGGTLTTRPQEPITAGQIPASLDSIPARFVVRGRQADVIAALMSNAACACIFESAGDTDV
jgi:hypothetical protein